MQFPRGKAEYFTAVVRWWSLMDPLTRLYGKWDQKSQSPPSRDCRMNIWNCFDSKSFGSSFCWWFPSRNEWHDRHNEQKLDGINYAASVEIQIWRRRSLCIWISALAKQPARPGQRLISKRFLPLLNMHSTSHASAADGTTHLHPRMQIQITRCESSVGLHSPSPSSIYGHVYEEEEARTTNSNRIGINDGVKSLVRHLQ